MAAPLHTLVASLSVIDAIKNWITGLDSFWIWGAAVGALLYALFDTKDTLEEIKAAVGLKKKLLRLKLLMLWGIPVLGLIGAYASELSSKEQTDKIANLTKTVEANDLKNLRVSDISAKARVELSGQLDGQPTHPMPIDLESFVRPMESNAPPHTLVFGAFQHLYASDVRAHETRSSGPTTHGYTINFRHDYGDGRGDVRLVSGGNPATVRVVLEKLNWLQIKLGSVPPNCEVLEGSVDLLINGTFKKQFIIPRQVCASNGTFYATNTVSN